MNDMSNVTVKPADSLVQDYCYMRQRAEELAKENAALREVAKAARDLLEYSHVGGAERWENWEDKFDALKTAIDAAKKEEQP